jgi:hypothetical protein
MNDNLKERAGMIKLIAMLGTLTVRLEVVWNWLRNMSSGRLGMNSVEPWGSGTRELVVRELNLSEVGCGDERMIELADDCVQC